MALPTFLPGRVKASDLNAVVTDLSTADTNIASLQTLTAALPMYVNSSQVTSNSSTFTTAETELQTVTCTLVNAKSYLVMWEPKFQSSVTGDEVRANIHVTNISGTQLQAVQFTAAPAGSMGRGGIVFAIYTAAASGSLTFSLSALRTSGSGNIQMNAASDRPCVALVLRLT